MDVIDFQEFQHIGIIVEGFFFGIYSGIFAIYLQHHFSKKDIDKRNAVIFYALCVLYMVSLATFITDIVFMFLEEINLLLLQRSYFVQSTVNGCNDFFAQSILIYRCWITWSCNIYVVILPSILAVIFLAMWFACANASQVVQYEILEAPWGTWLGVAGIVLSMIVNAYATGFIAYKIIMMYREIIPTRDPTLGNYGGIKYRNVISIIIESGMALFCIQLIRVVFTVYYELTGSNVPSNALQIIIGIHEIFNDITPTIILVRVSMGLSFYDEESLIESIAESLHFASKQPNSMAVLTGDDGTGIQRRNDSGTPISDESDDIEMVNR